MQLASHSEPIGIEVVHRLPGRCRLRFGADRAASGRLLAQRLAGHPGVVCVRWRPANRSLTVEYLPSVELDELLQQANGRVGRGLPEVAGSGLEHFAALGVAVLSGNLAEALLLLLLPVLLPWAPGSP
ncbi:MAG: hypothetical protein M3Y62_03500 [Candidatus Dormibacteraeota bacterium]|nr:hypothetical protein [Candidatus Dormibacteraeota bacterium]